MRKKMKIYKGNNDLQKDNINDQERGGGKWADISGNKRQRGKLMNTRWIGKAISDRPNTFEGLLHTRY